jgi:hypothetical protein
MQAHLSFTGAVVLYKLTPSSRVLLEKPTGFQLVKKFPAFMEPEGSLPHSQVLLHEYFVTIYVFTEMSR